MTVNWDKIYTGRGLYSGHGSRGHCATLKSIAIKTILDETSPRTLLDVGCGDLHVMSRVDLGKTQYTGIDGSDVLIRELRPCSPDKTLICAEFLEWLPPHKYDLVVCLDVLIHLDTQAEYRQFTSKLLQVCRGSLLVSGFTKNSPAIGRSSVIYFHESLLQTFEKMSTRTMCEYHESSLTYVNARSTLKQVI